MPKIYKRHCNHCGKYYEGYGKLFCSQFCSENKFKKGQIPWNKGKIGIQAGKNHPSWKGGLRKSNNRYFVWYHNHPFVTKQDYIPRARLIMEKKLGRYLKSQEVVHHINSNTLDDRPENLMLFSDNNAHAKFHEKTRKRNKQNQFI